MEKIIGLFVINFFCLACPAFASTGDIASVENFIKNIISILAGLSGLVSSVYFVIGGLGYITSSGNPEQLEKAKRTIMYAALGLSITLGAFVLSNIITDVATSAFGK